MLIYKRLLQLWFAPLLLLL